MDIFKRGAILTIISIILCSNCIFLYVTSGLFEVRVPWLEFIAALVLAYCIVWSMAGLNPTKYDHSIVKFCFTIIITVALTGSFILMKEFIAASSVEMPPAKAPMLPVKPKLIPRERERFNMKIINNNKKAGYMVGEIVVQFHDNTDQAAAKALIEANGCGLKAFSWEKVHIAYVTCPPGVENMKIAQLASQVKWAERIMNHDFHS